MDLMFVGALHDIWTLVWIMIKLAVIHLWWVFLILFAVAILFSKLRGPRPPSDIERGVPSSGDGYHT